jgi:hypothetical protein
LGHDGKGRKEVLEQSVSSDLWFEVRAVNADYRSKKFEVEKLSTEDVEMEDLNFYYADYSRYV